MRYRIQISALSFIVGYFDLYIDACIAAERLSGMIRDTRISVYRGEPTGWIEECFYIDSY